MRMVGQNGGKFERLIKFIKIRVLCKSKNFFTEVLRVLFRFRYENKKNSDMGTLS